MLHQLRVFERLRRSPAAAHVVLPAAVLMQRPVAEADAGGDAAVSWRPELAVAFPRLDGFEAGVPLPGHAMRAAVLRALRGALRSIHRAGVVHVDLFCGNVLWRAAGCDAEVRLVDFDAALEVGQAVPAAAREIVQRNGHLNSYDPELFNEGQVARPAFDWWHFVLLADDEAPFGKGALWAAEALAAWLQSPGRVAHVRELVAAELAAAAEA